jgi:hypothetical protein
MPALMLVIAVLSGGSWRVTGGGAPLAPLLVGAIGAVAAAYARTAPVGLGLMAAEVLAIGSLFRPGGVFGAAFLLVVGAAGGGLGGLLVDDSGPLAEVPGGEKSLQRIALGWGAVALVISIALAGWSSGSSPLSADDNRPRISVRQYRPLNLPTPCAAAALPMRNVASVSITSMPADGLAVGAMPIFNVRYDLAEGVAVPVAVYVVVSQVEDDGVTSYSGYLGQSDSAKGGVGASWNGDRCDEPARTFTEKAEAGEYIAHALVLSDGMTSASASVRFRVGES